MAEVIIGLCNMHGFFYGLDFVPELFENCDIVYIQEHWVRHGSISMFGNIFPSFTVLEHSDIPKIELYLYGCSYGVGIVNRNNCVKLIIDYGLLITIDMHCTIAEYNAYQLKLVESIYYYLVYTLLAKVIQIMLQL